jgi:oligoendopeptidase F
MEVAKELELRQQFLPGIDWTGLGTEMEWHLPSMHAPLHTLEYFYGRVTGLRLLSLPPTEAVARYKAAVALGNSVSTAALFQALGIRFPFTEADLASAATELAARGGIR